MWKCRRFERSRGNEIDALLKTTNAVDHALVLLVVVVSVHLVFMLSCLLVVMRKLV